MKVHVLLVCCLTTRAVAAEIVHSTSAAATVSALQRIFARRGFPERIYSDNQTGFRRSQELINAGYQAETFEQIAKLLDDKVQPPIEWKYGVPLAPWQQGFVERVVRSFKTTLQKMFLNTTPNYDKYATALAIVESMINSRVLAQGVDPVSGGGLVVTPSLLVNGRHLQFNPSFYDVTARTKKRGPDQEYVAFRTGVYHSAYQVWCEQYIKSLTPFTKWVNDEQHPPKVGDLVAVFDRQFISRGFPLAIVEKLNKSPTDNIIRSVDVRQGEAVYTRPCHRVYRLELQDNFEDDFDADAEPSEQGDVSADDD